MKEWDEIEKMRYEIPKDDGEVILTDYKEKVEGRAGVYRIYNDENKLMYIGQSTNLRKRIGEHFRGKRKGYFIFKVRYFYVEYE